MLAQYEKPCLWIVVYLLASDIVHAQDRNSDKVNQKQPTNIWDQLVGIIRQQSDPPPYLKEYVNNKKLDAEGRDTQLCEIPCENDGICTEKDTCHCVNNWYGPTCTLFECTEPCLNGQCRGPDVCFCDTGWSGISCNRPICNPSCMNKGTCVAPDRCLCHEGYVGQRCQDATCDPRCGHGSCYKPNQCMCDPGWRGPLCTQPVCQPGCKNEGDCTGPDECTCTPNWRGYKCEIPVCRNRCQNGGKCVAPDECKCLPRFVGDSCQIALDKEAHSGRTCTVWSSYHFRTFDGYAYDFPGLCRYELAFDKRDRLFSIDLIKNRDDFLHEGGHGSEFDLDNIDNGTDIVADVVRRYTGEFMAITLSIRGIRPTFTLLPTNLFLFGNKLIRDPQFTHQGIAIERIGRYIRVRTRVGVSILWDGDGVAEVEIENVNYQGAIGGLCGNFDSDPFNDIAMKDGTAASDFLDFALAWRAGGLHEECADITHMPIHCHNLTGEQIEDDHVTCKVLVSTLPAFQHCRDTGVDPTSFTDACRTDMCKCKKANRIDCVCAALTQYSRLCTHETGIAPDWRTSQLCGVTCPPDMVYTECSSSCPRTCQSLVTPDTECDDHCLDGCTCKNGTVLRQDRVCVPEEECPCIHGERSYAAGHVIKQNCMECQCSGALWNCKSLQCAGECSVVGDSHYTTFDGMLSKIYGECQFIFAKDCSGTELFSVVVENSLCANDLTETCISEVLVSVKPIAAGPGTARTSAVEDRSGEIKIRFGRKGRVTLGEQDVVLPFLHEHFQIFQASSEFVQLRLNFGITMDWDGTTRLYIRADRKWMGKVCGMCGNFNDNKRDDMMNFNGLVEKSATAFSNLWKVNADCKDATPDLNLDPCVSHPQRAEFAKERCGIIRQLVFRKCHPFVNPDDAEMICRQDVCQCDKGEACLCNAVAHYARQCAKKGQIVNWRTETFCPVVCTGGQVFQQCGSSCQSTCRSISDRRARCSEMCVEGCNCPLNMYLNEYKVCVPRTQCQCYHNGRVYQPFFILRRAFTTCHCRDGHFTCRNVENSPLNGLRGTNGNNNQTCKPGWIHHSCEFTGDFLDEYPHGIECQKTCKNLDTRCIATECVQGCGCPTGLVLNPDTNECIHHDECPCYLGGRSYGSGEHVQVDCNTCICERREWVCTETLCVGTCTAYGDPHYETFDGYKYDFMGQCGYILTQDYCGNQDGQFRVYAENMQCGSASVACTKSVTVALTGTIYIKLNKDTFGYTQRPLVDWGVLPGSTTNHTSIMWDFHHVGLYTFVTTDIGLTVIWDRKTSVYVKLEPKYRGRVCGLCGDFDGNQNNDMIMSDHMLGINPTEFGNSWKQSPLCHDVTEHESPCGQFPERKIWAQRSCKILYDQKFSKCHSVVDVVWYHTNCIYDACACDGGGDCECLCTAIAAYAHACSEEGIHIRWRTPHVCPLMCEGYDQNIGDCMWHYSECQSACPETCQHRYLSEGFDSCPLSVRCVEGCFPYCEQGFVYDEENRTCVDECVEGCHANGKLYHHGEVVAKETCRVCTCSERGGIKCSTLPECEVATETIPRLPFTTTVQPEIYTTIQQPISTQGTTTISDVLTPGQTKRYCFGAVNLGFIIEGSRHVSAAAFEDAKNIVNTLVESIMPPDYGSDNSTLKVLLGEFSDNYEEVMNFDRGQDPLSFSHTLRDMELHHGGGSRLDLALQMIVESYKKFGQLEKGSTEMNHSLVILLFSPPTNSYEAASKSLEQLGIKTMVLSVDQGPDAAEVKQAIGEETIVYELEKISDFINDTKTGMDMLERFCKGKSIPKPTPVPITTIPTEPPTTTTSTETPFESCTMIADLVVIIDVGFLMKTKQESDRFLTLLKHIFSDTLVRPDRTHVTILLSDYRIWRVGRFVATREELLGDLEDTILSSIRTKVFAPQHFDLNYALEQAVDGYLTNDYSGIRTNNPNVHKSVLVFQAREPYPEPTGDMGVLLAWMKKMKDEQIVINIVTQKKTFGSRLNKSLWKRSIGTKNLLFADIISKDITQTKFSLIMDRVCRTPPALPMPLKYCDGRTDLYFLWDDSDNIGMNDLRNMMQATKKLAGSLRMENFGKDTKSPLRVGIAQYSNKIQFLMDLNEKEAFRCFVKNTSPALPAWALGQESNLGQALSTIAGKLLSDSPGRNKTVVIFTSRPSTDDFDESLSKLNKMGTKVIAMGFAPDTNVKELKALAGDSGWYRRIASSRELLDNDIGMEIADEICLPGEVPIVTATVAPTAASEGITTTPTSPTKTQPYTGTTTVPITFPPAACAMSADIQIILDSNLTTDSRKSKIAFGMVKQFVTDLEIGDQPQQSRVGIVVAGQKPVVVSNLAKQGKDKTLILGLLEHIDDAIPPKIAHQPFSLAKIAQMSTEFVFDANERENEDEYGRHVVIVIDRLPENEIGLVRENSLDSVKSSLTGLMEEDIRVHVIYTEEALNGLPEDFTKEWLSGFEDQTITLEETDDAEMLGSELVDKLCIAPTTTTFTTLPVSTTSPPGVAITTPPLRPSFYCDHLLSDAVFLLENSNAVDEFDDSFQFKKEFLGNVVKDFHVSSEWVQIAVMQYDSRIHDTGKFGFKLGELKDAGALQNAIGSLQLHDASLQEPNLVTSLTEVLSEHFKRNGTNVARTVVVMTSTPQAKASSELRKAIDLANEEKVQVVFVASPDNAADAKDVGKWLGLDLPEDQMILLPSPGSGKLATAIEKVKYKMCAGPLLLGAVTTTSAESKTTAKVTAATSTIVPGYATTAPGTRPGLTTEATSTTEVTSKKVLTSTATEPFVMTQNITKPPDEAEKSTFATTPSLVPPGPVLSTTSPTEIKKTTLATTLHYVPPGPSTTTPKITPKTGPEIKISPAPTTTVGIQTSSIEPGLSPTSAAMFVTTTLAAPKLSTTTSPKATRETTSAQATSQPPGIHTSVSTLPPEKVSTTRPVHTTLTGVVTKEPNATCRLDLQMIVDSSHSIGPDFTTIKKFLEALVQEFDVASDSVRVGIVQYSKNSRTEFRLGDHIGDSDAMTNAIESMVILEGTTNTFTAMEYVTDNELLEINGRRNDVPLTIMLLTDGRIKDKQIKERVMEKIHARHKLLSDNGLIFNFLVVGFGSAHEDELMSISSHVLYTGEVSQFGESAYVKDIAHRICFPPAVTTTTLMTTTTPTPECAFMPSTDLLFILDGSMDMMDQTDDKMNQYLEFLSTMAAKFAIGPEDTQIGVTFYSDQVYSTKPKGFGPQDNVDLSQINKAIEDLQLPGQFVQDMTQNLKKIFATGFPEREEARKVAVVLLLTPGYDMGTGEKMEDVFLEARDAGIEIVILLGSPFPEGNQDIDQAVGPYVDESHKIFLSGGIPGLNSVTESLRDIICGEIPTQASTITPVMPPVEKTTEKPVTTLGPSKAMTAPGTTTERLVETTPTRKMSPTTTGVTRTSTTSVPEKTTPHETIKPRVPGFVYPESTTPTSPVLLTTEQTASPIPSTGVQITSATTSKTPPVYSTVFPTRIPGCENMPPTDIVFLIDGSRLPGMPSYEQVYKDFLQGITELLTIGLNDTQVALYTYNDEIFQEVPHGFEFDSSRNSSEIGQIIDGLRFPEGYLSDHIEPVEKILQTAFEETARQGARKVAVVLLSKVDTHVSNKSLSSVFEKASRSGIEVVVMGVSPEGDEGEMMSAIFESAGPTVDENRKIEASGGVTNIVKYVPQLRDAICGKLPTPVMTTTRIPSYTSERPSPTTKEKMRIPEPEPLCDDRVNVLFIVDEYFMASRSMVRGLQRYFNAALETVVIDEDHVRVSVAIMGKSWRTAINFQGGSKDDLLGAVNAVFSRSKRVKKLPKFKTEIAFNNAIERLSSEPKRDGSTIVLLLRTPPASLSAKTKKAIIDKSIVVSTVAVSKARGSRARSLASQRVMYKPAGSIWQMVNAGKYAKDAICTDRPAEIRPPPESQCPDLAADILLMISNVNSRKERPTELMERLSDLMLTFKIGTDVRVGIISYGINVTARFGFDTHQDKEDVIQALNDMEYDGDVDDSNAQTALNYIADNRLLFSFRPSVPSFILNIAGHAASETGEIAEISEKLARKNVGLITIGPNGFIWPNATVLPGQSQPLLNTSNEGYTTLNDDLMEILCMAYVQPQTAPPLTTITVITPVSVCKIASDTIFVIDAAVLQNSSNIGYVQDYLENIEAGLLISDEYSRTGLMTTGSNLTVWKQLNDYETSLTDAISTHGESVGEVDRGINIKQMLSNVIEVFESTSTRGRVKRNVVFLISVAVQDAILNTQWQKLKDLNVTMVATTIDTRFLGSDSVDMISYKEIPLPSLNYLPNAAEDTKNKICKPLPERIPPELIPPILPTEAPMLICPAGDVVMMYDSMFLTPDTEGKLKKLLKNMAKLLENTYSSHKTRFSLVSFGNEPELHFGLGSLKTLAQVNRAIDDSQHHGSDSPFNAAKALSYVLHEVINTPRTNKENVSATIFMFISRPSFDNLAEMVQSAVGVADIITFVVGYEHDYIDGLTTVPYGGVHVVSFDKARNLEYETLELICNVVQPTTTAAPPVILTTKPALPCKVDLLFVLDEQLMTSSSTVNYVKQYINLIAKHLVFGKDYFRVGALQLSEESLPLVMDGFANSLTALESDMDTFFSVTPITGSLDVVSGLNSALREFERNGRHQDSGDVSSVVVFILRRRPTRLPEETRMRDLLNKGVSVIAVVVDDALSVPRSKLTNYDRGYVRAYRPNYLSHFASPVVYFLWNMICLKTEPTQPPPTPLPPEPLPPTEPVCSRVMDVAYVLDESLLQRSYMAQTITSVIKDTLHSVDLGAEKTRFSIVSFASVPKLVIGLWDAYEKMDAFEEIEAKVKKDGTFDTQANITLTPALYYASNHVLREEGMRDAEKVIVLFAGRRVHDTSTDLRKVISALQNMKIKLVSVVDDNSELKNTLPEYPENTFTFKNADDLPYLVPEVNDILCEKVAATTTAKAVTTTTKVLEYASTTVGLVTTKTSIIPESVTTQPGVETTTLVSPEKPGTPILTHPFTTSKETPETVKTTGFPEKTLIPGFTTTAPEKISTGITTTGKITKPLPATSVVTVTKEMTVPEEIISTTKRPPSASTGRMSTIAVTPPMPVQTATAIETRRVGVTTKMMGVPENTTTPEVGTASPLTTMTEEAETTKTTEKQTTEHRGTTEGPVVEIVTVTPGGRLEVDCSTLKLDLMILLQASDYLAKFGSEHMKSFAQKLATYFKIGQDNVLASVLQFDDDIVSDSHHMDGFQFDYVSVPQVMRDVIFQLHIDPGEKSDPGNALNNAIENYMSAEQGARDKVRKAVLMVLEVPPRNESLYAFNQAIRNAVKKHISMFLLAIPTKTTGVDDTSDALSRINQLPRKNKVVATNRFNDLSDKDFIENLGQEICQDVPYLLPEITTTHPVKTTAMPSATLTPPTEIPTHELTEPPAISGTSTTAKLSPVATSLEVKSTAPEGFVTRHPLISVTVSPPSKEFSTIGHIEKVCEYASDIVMIVDTSDLSQQKLDIVKQFLASLIAKFEIGNDKTKVAVIPYGTIPSILIDFSDDQTYAALANKIETLSKSGKYTNTGAALKKAQELLLTARPGVPWNVLLLTDARSKDSFTSEIEALKKMRSTHVPGVKFAAVGLQAASLQELGQFADDDSIANVDSYENLAQNITLQSVYNLLCLRPGDYIVPGITTPTVSSSTTPPVTTIQPGISTGPSTIRPITIQSSTVSYTQVCDCYWTSEISRDSPTTDKPGDDESWASSNTNFGSVCKAGYEGFNIQCQTSEGLIQPNVHCDTEDPPVCYAFQVGDGSGCFDYSVSVRCCSQACEKTSAPPTVKKEPFCIVPMDIVYVVDTTQSEEWLTTSKKFLDELLTDIKYGPANTRSSLVTYGSGAPEVFSDWTHDKRPWRQTIDNIKKSPPGLANVAGALGTVVDELAPKTRGLSDGVLPKKAIVVVASGSTVGTIDGLVKKLKDDEFVIISIGVEEPRESLMQRIASNPNSVFTPSSKEDYLNSTASRLINLLCGEEEITTTEATTLPLVKATTPLTSTTSTEPETSLVTLATTPPTTEGVITIIAEVTDRFLNATSTKQPTKVTNATMPTVATPPTEGEVTIIMGVTERFMNATSTKQPTQVTNATTPTVSTSYPTTSRRETTEAQITTTEFPEPEPQCLYYDESTSQFKSLEYGEVIYPTPSDKCTSLRCADSGQMRLEDKRKICQELSKPACENGIEPVLHYDSSCNCQWDCQCYCQVSGITHHSFDGLTYPVGGECTLILSQATERAKRSGLDYVVTYHRSLCNNDSVCITKVTIERLHNTLQLFKNFTAFLNSELITSSNGDVELSLIGEVKFAVQFKDIGLELEYEPNTNGISLSLAPYLWHEDTEGLCGTCNNVSTDDLQLRNKLISDTFQVFAHDWSLGGNCGEHVDNCYMVRDDHCDLIKNGSIFAKCREHLDWRQYYKGCIDEVCRNPNSTCTKLAGFAEACRHVGLCVEWRTTSLCPQDCEDGRLFKACVEAPYDMSCPSDVKSTIPKTGVDTFAEGCFYNCSRDEVVIDGRCVPKNRCQQCYGAESSEFKEPGDLWVPQGQPCDVCACKEDLTIQCEERSCEHIPSPPICGNCERLSPKLHTDSCCPEYECVCDYTECEAALPSEPCGNGEIMRLTTNNTSCQPSYECFCDLDRCNSTTLTCDPPMTAMSIVTPCCPDGKCQCPDRCAMDNTTCELGFQKAISRDICNCSRSTCERMSVCVVSSGEHTVLKIPGEEWIDSDDACNVCHCNKDTSIPGPSMFSTMCTNQSHLCQRCSKGYSPEYSSDECCPKCIPNACIYTDADNTTTIHDIGDIWLKPNDNCRNLTCILYDGGLPVVVDVASDCTRTVPERCEFGYELKCNEDPCCPDCRCVPQDVCIFNSTVLQKPGNTWNLDVCTSCECTHERLKDGFYKHVCTSAVCQQCGQGYMYHAVEGTCCGECIPTVCSVVIENETRKLEIGEEVQNQCNITRCVQNNDGYALTIASDVSCPQLNQNECVHLGGTIALDESGCCRMCEFRHRECQVHAGSEVEITTGDCTTTEKVALPYCQGECTSGAHYHAPTGEFVRHCSCCKPISYENRTQGATCTDGSNTVLSYRFVTECSCERVACTEWTKIEDDGKIISYAISPKSASSTANKTKTVISAWAMNDTMKVVEITDLSEPGPNVAAVFREAMEEYGLGHLSVQTVQMSAENSTLIESLKKTFAMATTKRRTKKLIPPDFP